MGSWEEKKGIASVSCGEAQRNYKELKFPSAGTGNALAPWKKPLSWRKQDHREWPWEVQGWMLHSGERSNKEMNKQHITQHRLPSDLSQHPRGI